MADPTASGVPSLDEFLTEVKPLNPDASNSELIDAYHQQFGTTPTAAAPRATLPSYDEFKPEVKRLNPTATNSEIHQAWQDEFGVMGAREKKPSFSDAFGSGLKQGFTGVKESYQGTKERLLDPNDPLKKFTREAGDALAGEAAKLGVPEDLQSKPFWDRVRDPEWMGNFLGNTLAGSAPSMAGAVAGGVAGALTPIPGGAAIGAAAGMGGVTFFQEAGSSYREAYDKYIKAGFSEQKAHENAYEASGVAGAVSGVVNSLAVPASLMSPAKSVVKNLFMRYLANVAIDTGDQITGNIVAKQYHDPDREVMQGAPEAVLGSAILGAPETMGAVKIGVMPKQVAKQRAQPDQGLTPDSATPGLRNTPLKTELRVDGKGPPVAEPDPLTHAEPVLRTTTVDDAIEVASKVTDDVPIDLDALKREVGEEVTVEKIEAEKTADTLAKQAQREADQDLVEQLAMSLPDDRVNGRLDAIDTSTLPDTPDAENPTQLTKPQYQALSDIYQLDGKRLVVVSPNAKFAGVVNAAVSDSTAFISARTGSDPANVAFHEYQHLLQKSEVFETYRSTLREELQPDATDTAKKYHSRAKGISDDQLFNEISADVHGDAMTRPTFHAKLIQKLEALEGPDVAQTKLTTLLDSLKEMLGRLQQYLTGRDYTKLDADGKAVAERYVKNLKRVHDALASAMAEHYRKQGLLADGAQPQVIDTPRPDPGVTFETAKGSTYTVKAKGVTIRNQVPRPDLPGQEGIQPASEQTVYVDAKGLEALREFHTPGTKRKIIPIGKGQHGVQYASGAFKDRVEARTVVNTKEMPEVGLHPVEISKGGEKVHFGSKITKLIKAEDLKKEKAVTKRDLKKPAASEKAIAKSDKQESTPVEQTEKKEVAVKKDLPAKKTDTKAVTKVDELQEAFGADTKEVKQLLDILDNPAPRGKIQAAESRLQEVMSKNAVSQKEFNRLAYGIGTKDIDVKPEDYTAFAPNLDPGYTVSQPTAIDTYIRKLQDKNIDLKRLIESIEKSGQKVPDELNPVFREEMFHKRAEQRSTDFTNNELKPLLKWMRANKISLEQLDQYMHARHVINDNLNTRLKEINPDLDGTPEFEKLAGVTDAEAKAILKKFDKTLMETAAKKIDAMIEKTRVMMVDYGLESQERIDGWRDQYRSYVPLHREGFEDGGHPTGTGMSVRGTTAKDRLGSALKVVDVVANIAQARDQVISRGEKMRPVVALAGLLLKFPNKDLAKLDKYAPVTVTDPTTGLETTIPGDLGDYKRPMINRKNKKTGLVTSRPDPTYKSRDNVVNFRIGGKDYAIIFNERDERAKQIAIGLKNLDTPPLNGILRAVAPYTRYLAAVNTQYNPIFGAVNFVRDAQFAMLTLKSTELDGKQAQIVTNAKSALFGIWQDARAVRRGETATSPTAQLWERFQHVGGPTGYRDLFFTSTERAEELTRLLSPNGWKSIRSLPHFIKQMENTWLFEKLADYNLAMENAIRLGVFQAGVENGLSDIKAASLAKNITVNFNKKGQIGAQAGALYAFFNANVQGTARILETIAERAEDKRLGWRFTPAGKQIIVGGLLVGVLQTFALALAGFDDDEPPEFIKNRNFVIPAPGTDKGYLSIPMPLGFNLLPTVGRLAAETIYAGLDGRSPKIMEKGATLMAAMVDTFNPLGSSSSLLQVGSPTVTDPIVALAENKDWTGKPISHPDYSPLRPTPGHTRAKDTATIWSIGLSKMINWATGGTDYVPGALSPTPDAIDYLIGQATGGVGREISKAAQVARSEISGEALPVYKLPAIGRFAGTAGGTSGIRDKFYDHIREVNAGALEVEGRMKNGESFSEFLKEHPESRLKSTALRFQKQLGDLRQQKTQLLDRSAPKSEVERKEQQITNLMKMFNDQVERVKKPQ